MMNYRITTEQWKKMENMLPPERKPQGGRPAKDNRMMLNGMIYWINTGVTWRDLPEEFGPWQSVYGRLRTWKQQGVWKKLIPVLLEQEVVDTTQSPPPLHRRGRKVRHRY